MPAFFILAGYLYKPISENENIIKAILKRSKRILIPYIVNINQWDMDEFNKYYLYFTKLALLFCIKKYDDSLFLYCLHDDKICIIIIM